LTRESAWLQLPKLTHFPLRIVIVKSPGAV
jgi:hypothetical protein